MIDIDAIARLSNAFLIAGKFYKGLELLGRQGEQDRPEILYVSKKMQICLSFSAQIWIPGFQFQFQFKNLKISNFKNGLKSAKTTKIDKNRSQIQF